MERNEPLADETWRFVQDILGKPTTHASKASAEREHAEWLAAVAPRDHRQLGGPQRAEVEATVAREKSRWPATATEDDQSLSQSSLTLAAEIEELQARLERLIESLHVREANWDPDKHPRAGSGPNAGWWASTGGASGSDSERKPTSFLDAVIKRNHQIADLTGFISPETMRSSRLAVDLQSAGRLPGDVAQGAVAGLRTGAKAVVNGSVTAIKNVVTLGLDSHQLELIGVTKEDRERGYDKAVTIATASGEILIAVVTSGIAAALSKGGTIARTAAGALIAYDAAGSAVGVVRGLYDVKQNGITLSNGTQIAAGLLGLGANAQAAQNLGRAAAARRFATVDEFVAKCPRKTTPTTSAANQYEIKHTGPYNYTVSGGGESFDIDGFRGTTILEAKQVGSTKSSPYVPGSSCPAPVRTQILNGTREELRRIRTIIESGNTPFKSVEIITNSPEAKRFFEGLLKEAGVPGTVRLEP